MRIAEIGQILDRDAVGKPDVVCQIRAKRHVDMGQVGGIHGSVGQHVKTGIISLRRNVHTPIPIIYKSYFAWR